MPGIGGISQRLLRMEEPQGIKTERAQSGAEAAAGGTARKISRNGAGQPVPPAETGIWLFAQAGPPANAAVRHFLNQTQGL